MGVGGVLKQSVEGVRGNNVPADLAYLQSGFLLKSRDDFCRVVSPHPFVSILHHSLLVNLRAVGIQSVFRSKCLPCPGVDVYVRDLVRKVEFK